MALKNHCMHTAVDVDVNVNVDVDSNLNANASASAVISLMKFFVDSRMQGDEDTGHTPQFNCVLFAPNATVTLLT